MTSLRRLFPLLMAPPVACGGTDDQDVLPEPMARLEVSALAGPACPVETDPPSPQCSPRPVAAVAIAVNDIDGTELARGATGSDGKVVFDLSPGELAIVPQAVAGLPGTAAMVTVTMTPGQTLQVTAMYDTGIR